MKNRLERVLVLGEPGLLPRCLETAAGRWLAICKAGEASGSAVRLEEALELEFRAGFDIDEYLGERARIIAWAGEKGPFDRIVAHTEYTIQIGAVLRERLGVAGRGPKEAARVRDKGVMKAAIASAGVPTAGHLDLANPDRELSAWIAGKSGKLVLKPKTQAGSRGVEIHASADSILERVGGLSSEQRAGFLVEEFIDLPILHIDGLVRDGELKFACASRYLDTCLEWLSDRKAMGSVLISDPAFAEKLVAFARSVVAALELRDTVFHLEAFYDGTELWFLEIAGRPGGAGIVPHVRAVFGLDLQEEMVRIDLGLPQGSAARGLLSGGAQPNGGWIVTPNFSARRFRVTGLVGLDRLPAGIYHSEVPALGRVFNESGDEGLPSGKFYVRTSSESDTERMLRSIAESYRLKGEEY